MKIFHSSDEHFNWLPLADFADKNGQPDLWILSGDFFGNLTRGKAEVEVPYQTGYYHASRVILKRAFGKTPILVQSGNHCYADLVSLLHQDMFNPYRVERKRNTIRIKGVDISYAGFSEIPYIAGDWNGETDHATLTSIVNEVMDENPDFLINHPPPAGIMDGRGMPGNGVGYGVSSVANRLFYDDRHTIKGVFYGHQHRVIENPRILKMDDPNGNPIIFSNAATTINVVEFETKDGRVCIPP